MIDDSLEHILRRERHWQRWSPLYVTAALLSVAAALASLAT